VSGLLAQFSFIFWDLVPAMLTANAFSSDPHLICDRGPIFKVRGTAILHENGWAWDFLLNWKKY
jgi:hypothetical protein